MSTKIPYFKEKKLLGSTEAFVNNPRQFLQGLSALESPLVKFRLAHMQVYYLSSPEATLDVMQRRYLNYEKGGPAMDIGRKVMGNGLPFSNGNFWKRQRRIANPAFHNECLQHYTRVMQQLTTQMLDDLAQRSESAKPIDIHRSFNELAIAVVRDNLFGNNVSDSEMTQMLDAIGFMLEEATKHIRRGFMIPFWIPTSSNRK
ncbi:MAG: cytochrome P450, partial [Bacteroidota bacterium]